MNRKLYSSSLKNSIAAFIASAILLPTPWEATAYKIPNIRLWIIPLLVSLWVGIFSWIILHLVTVITNKQNQDRNYIELQFSRWVHSIRIASLVLAPGIVLYRNDSIKGNTPITTALVTTAAIIIGSIILPVVLEKLEQSSTEDQIKMLKDDRRKNVPSWMSQVKIEYEPTLAGFQMEDQIRDDPDLLRTAYQTSESEPIGCYAAIGVVYIFLFFARFFQ